MFSQLRRCHGIDSLELKALSVPSSLRFLLGIEYDVVLCVTEVGSRRPFTLHFPVFAETFRKLLHLCAMRFSLECKHNEDGSSELSGSAVMPLLRYADYLPGALHVEELLECLQVVPSTSPKRRAGASATSTDFEASFLDYSEFTSDASLNDVHGLGFYLTLDYGLSLASHSHLVDIRFHDDWDPKEAIREFQEFSGWETFDLRFYDDRNKREGGVIVFPTIQDVCDLLEKYEDEDSDDEGDLLPFVLRPVAALVPVPSIEDSVLRKQREQNWSEMIAFWERFPRTRHTVVVYNLFEGATLADVLAFMEHLPVQKATLVEDRSPQKRRRAFITFGDAESTKKALELDGKSTKGRTLRVQVSPPYIDEDRRGVEVKEPVKTKGKSGGKRGGTGEQSSPATGAATPGPSNSGTKTSTSASTEKETAASANAPKPPPPTPATEKKGKTTAAAPAANNEIKKADATPAAATSTGVGKPEAGKKLPNAPMPLAIPKSKSAAQPSAPVPAGASNAVPVASASAAVPPPLPPPVGHSHVPASSKALEAAWASAAHGLSKGAAPTPAAAAGAATTAADRAAPGHPAAAPTSSVGSSNAASAPHAHPAPPYPVATADKHHHLQIPVPASVARAKEATGSNSNSKSPSPSLMNAEAKEFVPTFKLNVNSPEFRPEAPPSYMDPHSTPFALGADELLPPPLLPPPMPAPPSYGAAALSPNVGFVGGPPLPRSVTGSASLTYRDDMAPPPPPPPFAMPPPYLGVAPGMPLPPPPPPPPPPPY